jgi:hypothetical protein
VSDLPAAARVIEPPHERPQELHGAGEHFTKVGQQDQKQGDAENRVDDGNRPTRVCGRCYVTVA